ncbi:MAG: hypothetical protein ACYCOR_18140 [Acidobacteriaceae bacterium]
METMSSTSKTAILLIDCPDRKGLVAAIANFLVREYDANVLNAPIIEQDVARVSQNDQLPGLIQKGRDLERMVLSRAVQWHLARRILCYANKTVIFA